MKLDHKQFMALLADFRDANLPIITKCNGASMIPALYPGTEITIAPASLAEIKRGDIILIKIGENESFLHRIHRIYKKNNKQWIQTWGDNNTTPDPPVLAENILGKVTLIKGSGTWQQINPEAMLPFLFSSLTRYGKYYGRRLYSKIIHCLLRKR